MLVDIIGNVVDTANDGYTSVIKTSGGETVKIESSFELSMPGRFRVVIDPQDENTDDKTRISVLLGRAVVRAEIAVDEGSLFLEFDGGVEVRVSPDPDYEAWTLFGPGGEMVVSLPGGGVGIWDARE